MIWIAAIMMMAQAAVSDATAQQELSKYNFEAAGAALSATQQGQKQNPLSPIPPLQLPAITSRGSVPPPSTKSEKGAEVPPNWKPPHAK